MASTTKNRISHFLFSAIIILLSCRDCNSTIAAEQRLHDDFLANYSTHLRPVANANTQTVVNITVGLMQIEAVSEKEQKLISHGFFTLTWRDEIMQWDPANYDDQEFIIVMGDKIWLPEITPINSLDSTIELSAQGEDTRVKVFHTGVAYWAPALRWETTCDINVGNFPYDTQTCYIEYANWMYTAQLVNFSAPFPTADSSNINNNLEWTLESTSVTVNEVASPYGVLPMLRIGITIKRDPTFFEVNVLLPAMLLSFIMIPIFILPVESGEKTSLGITLMLAYSIFLLMMTDVTPRSSTTPRLTILILSSSVFSGVAIVLSVIVINFHHHRPEKPVPKWVKYLFLVKISKFLCCMNYADENEVEPIKREDTNDGIFMVSEKGKQKIALGNEFSDMSRLVSHNDFIKRRAQRKDELADNKDDWMNLARVVDRLFMWIYVIIFLANFISVMIIKFGS